MATATFHSIRGEKSALILLKVNALQFGATPVYVPRAACINLMKGDTIEVPDGYRLVPMVDADGNIRRTSTGEALNTITW